MAKVTKFTPPVAVVNIYGPDGELCPAGAQLPPSWNTEFVDELLQTGGATTDTSNAQE